MKSLFPFIFPVLKAVITVVGFMIGIGWGAYQGVSRIAKAEAGAVREEIKTIRSLDMEHLNRRFDKIEELIKEKK
jgi:hypothetical protein